jgi:hypothetical protein
MSVEEMEKKTESGKKTESEIKMKLGDIIKIESTNPDYNSYFFVEYIDDEIIKITNVENGKKETIDLDQDGCLTETTIQRIILHSRSDEDGYARQNGLLQETYVKLVFADNIEITGKITTLEEDMIEILLTGEEDEKIYIDFEYKGIPKNIPLKTITIIEQPSVSEVIEKKMIQENAIVEETSHETASIEYGSEGEIYIDIPNNPKLDITPPVVFGKEIEFVADTGVWEQRYGIEMQTTDLLNELLSTIPDNSRTSTVMERVYRVIRRFKELREQFSVFDENGNVVSSKKVSALYKPLVERMINLDINLKWIIPVVTQKTKLYTNEENETIENSDINKEIEEYKNNLNVYKTTNSYPAFYNAVNDMFTPFAQPFDKKYTVNAELETIVDNLENYYTHVYKDALNTKKKRFFFQRYNLGMTKIGNKEMRSGKSIYMRENMTKNDAVSIKSVFMLPKPAIQFSRINLPGTNILSRAGLSHNWMYYFAFLNKRTYFKSIQLENVDEGYDYKKENDFLDTPISFDIPNEPNYESLLKTIIPMSASIIRLLKSEYIGYNFHDIISFYEPFMLYLDTITYSGLSKIKEGGPYQEMRIQILENIKKYDEEFKKKSKKYQSFPKGFAQKKNSFLSAEMEKIYKLDETMSSTETLNKMLELDNSKFYMSNLSLTTTKLYTPDLSELIEKSEYGKDSFVKQNLCFTRVIAKKYTSIKSLNADNNEEDIYFDKEYDTTPYDILKKYKETQSKQSPSDFLDYFTTVLSKEHGINDEQLAKTIIRGKKKVEENNYAILVIYPQPISSLEEGEEKEVEIEADVKKKVRYFKRVGIRWIEDTDMADSELTNELLCNTDKNCSYSKEVCNAKETTDNFTEKIKKTYALREKQIKRIRAIKEAKNEEFSLRAYLIGKNIILPEIKTSPHAELRDKILGLKTLSTKQEFIQKFVKNFCRKSLAHESVDWLYCKETNTKLLPNFFELLANIFFLDVALYEEHLDMIIATQGTKSDDGDAIIDKHSGYVIKYLDYVAQDEFDENGFVIKTHSIIEKNMSEILEDAIHAEIENNQTMPTVSDKKHFDNPIHEDIYKVSKAILTNLGIEFEKIFDTIISHTSRIITKYLASEEKYNASIAGKEKMLKYKDYKNQQIFFFTVGITLIVYQTHIPSFQPKKTFPGCVYSLSGYPLDEISGDKSGITYLCCVLEKMKNATTYPWKSVSKFTSEKFQEKISKDFLDKILKDSEIQHLLTLKRHYLLTSPEVHHIPLEHRVEKWALFQPPLIKSAVEKTVSGVSKTIGDEIRDTMKSGNANQHKYIGTLYKKIIEHTYLTIDDINAIVHDIGKDALLKAGTIVFLENSCCESSVNRKVIDYFTEKNENIQKCIEFVHKYEKIYDEIKLLTIPAFAGFKVVRAEPPPPLANVYNETNIYSAIIHYCKLKTNLPIPSYLEPICQEKIVGLETMNANQAIDKLKEKYKNPAETIAELMKIVSLQNRVEILLDDENVDDVFIRDSIDERIKIALTTENTDSLMVFLYDSIETMQKEIQKYIREHNRGLKKTDSKNLFEFIQKGETWSDYKHMYPFIKNAVYNVIKVIPSLINNDGLKNMSMENKKHWGFSGKHKDNLTGFVENYFEKIRKYIKRERSLCSFFKEIHDGEDFRDIELLVSQLPTIKFEAPVMHKIYNYCYLKVYYTIIQKSLTHELNISMVDKESTDFGMMEVRVEDNRDYFCQEVSKLMTDILKMDMENKKMINFNYAELFDKYKRDANSEKIEITTRLGNMDNFERGIEDLMKEYKMGDWKEDKGVFQYDPKYYDEEIGVPEEPDESIVLEEGDAENNFDNNE